MKYVLEKKIQIAAGSHKVFFGLLDEPYYTTVDIFVKSGGLNVLEFKPDYKYKTFPTRIPTFLRGVEKFEVMFKRLRFKIVDNAKRDKPFLWRSAPREVARLRSLTCILQPEFFTVVKILTLHSCRWSPESEDHNENE